MRDDFDKTLCESQLRRYSVYLLYWYKSTNTDADAAVAFSPNGAFLASGSGWLKSEGPHLTCFTGTKSTNTGNCASFSAVAGAKA